MSLQDRLKAALREALKSRDPIAIAALRSTVSSIANAEAVESSHSSRPRLGVGAGEAVRKALSDQDVFELLRAEVDDRLAAAGEYERLVRPDEADRLRAQAAVLEAYLPKR